MMTPKRAEIARSDTVRPPRQGRFQRHQNDCARQDAPPRDGRGFDGRKGDDGERRAHILDEARADDVELWWDAVDHRDAVRAPGGCVHWAGAKIRAAEFMQ